MRNHLELRVQPGAQVPANVVRIIVDGHDLVDLVRPIEAAWAAAELHPDMAGRYDGLTPDAWLELPERYARDDRVAILACECGEVGCWPLRVRIHTGDETVTWNEFEQPYRDWTYDTFGPFVFDRAQYLMEVARIQALARQADV